MCHHSTSILTYVVLKFMFAILFTFLINNHAQHSPSNHSLIHNEFMHLSFSTVLLSLAICRQPNDGYEIMKIYISKTE